MNVQFGTTWLAPGGDSAADQVRINGVQVIDVAQYFRAVASNFFPRGDLSVELSFVTHWQLNTVADAEVFVLTHPSMLPMTSSDLSTVTCVCGAESAGSIQTTAYMTNAVLESVRLVRYIGSSVDFEYTIRGPGFTSSTPPNLPISPTPNVPAQVYVRGKTALTSGQTSVSVSYGSTLPGSPGADPDCWISAPTGSEVFQAWTESDSVTTTGFNAILGEAVPGNGYFLNWVVFM